jgi:hypothetical protein
MPQSFLYVHGFGHFYRSQQPCFRLYLLHPDRPFTPKLQNRKDGPGATNPGRNTFTWGILPLRALKAIAPALGAARTAYDQKACSGVSQEDNGKYRIT